MQELVQKLGNILLKKRKFLTCAESCTGGMVSTMITDCPGASQFFDRGFITYSNAAKIDMLGVSAQTLECYGAVSEECAIEMALGALDNSNADISVAITGIAGPGGGAPDKPVGLVCIATCSKNGAAKSHKNNFSGARKEVRKASTQKAFELLVELAGTI
ncbi:MAG: CinA family protein [Alphaproteobacteria bacterium]